MYDIYCPKNGGVQVNIPPGHFHAGYSKRYYYDRLANRLGQLGYTNEEYSAYSKPTTGALAIQDAINLQTHPNLTWMAVPGVMRRMHVVEFVHGGSLY